MISVIIWINGAFGAGKSQTAYELHRRTINSYLYDPENAGYFIQKNTPKTIHKDDFQNYSMWREFNYSMLKHLDASYDGVVIAPMTIVHPSYFNEIIGKLREDGVLIHHFALCASEHVLRKRLRSRGESNNSWAVQQIDRCVVGLADQTFQHHIDTDNMSVEDNVEYIASMSNISLLPDNRGSLKRVYDRVKTQVKQIRL